MRRAADGLASEDQIEAAAHGPAEDAAPSETRPLGTLWQDVRYGARGLYKNPGFATVAVLTLALGIGANTAIFSIVRAALLTPIAVPDPNRVAMVWTDRPTSGSQGFPASVPDFVDWRDSGVFEKLAGFTTDGFNMLIGVMPEHVPGASVTKQWFEILQVRPFLGRVFQEQDMQHGHNHAVVLTYDLWASRFNSDPTIVGKSTIINNAPYTVLGVLPKNVVKVADEELYVPLLFEPPFIFERGLRLISTIGRLAPGVTFSAAQRRMADIGSRLAAEYPKDDGGTRTRLQPIEEAYVENVQTLVLVLFGAVGFLLLIACANIANLLLVRGMGRQREIAIRSAIGATRSRLIRQLLTESVLLAICGGLAGVLPAFFGVRLLARFEPQALPNSQLVGLNPAVLLFALLLALFTGVLFGLVPAWQAWRTNAESPLKERSQTSGRERRLGDLFVVAEIALTVVLVAGAGLTIRSFMKLRTAYPGYDASHVLTMRVSLTGKQYDPPEKQIAFFKDAVDRLSGFPGVRAAGAIDALPTSSDVQGGVLHFTDRPEPKPSEAAVVIIGSATPGYFEAMRIPLIRGRLFSDQDGARDPLVVIIDQGLARQYWPNRDPIGQSVRLRKTDPLRKIVGVVGNIDHPVAVNSRGRLGQAYVPFAQASFSEMSIAIAARVDPRSLVSAAQRLLSELAPDQPVYQVQTLEELRSAARRPAQFAAWLLGFFASLSLLLAAIGVYGVVSYAVAQRTREIGVRMALGATRWDLLSRVLGQGLRLTGAGLVGGLIAAVFLTKLLGSMLHGVSATDPVTLLCVAMVLTFVALLATFLPAYRASRVEPMVALRHE